ncbi:hypothetical protein M4951_21500 [Blastopirellula sp. J2-11]|uniref:hypothetical protein n=1 Tax=Blastopirellula sp. J2-11 TaxID=2943192 RepID=UPI0021C7D5CA|nr:hypothetical protein [Blastopirellula sp. J2-11]UUO05930.1 hypothetical protein M4951_21500 [Blastopirellula sp. J2-11]
MGIVASKGCDWDCGWRIITYSRANIWCWVCAGNTIYGVESAGLRVFSNIWVDEENVSNQSITNESTEVDRLAEVAKPPTQRLAIWRFLASIAAMAACWGLMLLIAWFGRPGFIIAILLIYSGFFAAVSQLAILISWPLIAPVTRLPVGLALLLIVMSVFVVLFEVHQSDELHLWLILIASQFMLVTIASLVVRRFSRFRPQSSRHFSLLTLILTVTVVCVGLGAVRAIAAALDIGFAEFAESRVANFLTVALINATAATGPLLALTTRRILFRVLLLIIGLPQALLLSLAILWLHDWAAPDEHVLNAQEMVIFIGMQATSISLGMLPIVFAPKKQLTSAKVEPPSSGVLQQDP